MNGSIIFSTIKVPFDEWRKIVKNPLQKGHRGEPPTWKDLDRSNKERSIFKIDMKGRYYEKSAHSMHINVPPAPCDDDSQGT